MKRFLFSILIMWSVVAISFAQTTILDFETPSTSANFQYFGSAQDGSLAPIIANPNPTGANTSSMVTQYVKPAVSEVWAGAFANPNPTTVIDFSSGGKLCVKVHMDHIGSVSIKLEERVGGGDTWITTVANTKVNEWEELCFDSSLPSIEGNPTVAAGAAFAKLVIFIDFGNVGTGTNVTTYLDDFILKSGPPSTTTNILDFETPATSSGFQYFGSALDGSLAAIIANPNPTGANTSSMVTRYVKPAVSEVWAGAFANPNPTAPIDFSNGGKICIKVHMDHIGSVSIKLEERVGGGDTWITTVANTKVNEWEELCFDSSLPSIEGNPTAAAGAAFAKLVIFIDFGTAGTGTDVTTYFDDFVVKTAPSATTTNILDFEAPATSSGFQYFGSALDGSIAAIIANPNPTGANTSSMVTQYVKPGVSQVWAGAFANPNPTTPIDFSNGGQLCVKVHMDHIGSVSLKLEERVGGGDTWITTVANTKVNEWEELCFDSSLPSIEGNPTAAAGAVFAKLVIFIDFGTAGTGTDVTTYFDDFVVKTSNAPVSRTINFKVDMNNYAPDFNTVYVSGSFNNWSDNANPMTDANSDGIWEGSISVPNGAYEYKIQLDQWAAQEIFAGTEVCTKRTDDFVNRLLLVSADADLPTFCFNSCYACGQEVKLTFKLGMNGVTPNPDGVWLAGGGNFQSPGGNYKMNDANGDGIFEIVVPRQKGFSSYYVFANGPCPDYSCKEQIAGLPCSVPTNFDDRFLPNVAADTTIATCFGTCFTNALCISGTQSPQLDAQVFSLRGNPIVNGVTVIDFGANQTDSKLITLTNSIGQVMQSLTVEQYEQVYTMPVYNLQAGIYFVTVTTGDRYFTRKIVKY